MIDPNLGQVVADQYELIRLVGKGGYGSVYVGEPVGGDGPPVAVKLLKTDLTDQAQVLRRFEREARVMQRLDSPHTPRLHASGPLPRGGAFIAMDFIDGVTLSSILREGPLAPDRVVRVARAVLDVLIRLHALDPPVYHRDLKPGNLMLCTHQDGEEAVYVLDFGIAKIDHEAEQERTVQTAQGMLPGSISYSAPERFEGRDDPRSDLYSLGVIMFEALSGRNPFRRQTPLASMRAHAFAAPPADLTEKGIDPALVRFVHRALAKEPDARFENAQAMLDALKLLPISAPEEGEDTELTPLPAQQLAIQRWGAQAPEVPSTPPASDASGSDEGAPAWVTSDRVAPAQRWMPAPKSALPTPGQVTSAARTPPPAEGRDGLRFQLLVGLAIAGVALIAWLVLRPPAEPEALDLDAPATPESAALVSAAPATAASSIPDRYQFVTVIVRPGPARFVQVESKTVLCEGAQRCQVPIDVDTRVEQDGYVSRVLSGDDLFDRRGHRWKVRLRARK